MPPTKKGTLILFVAKFETEKYLASPYFTVKPPSHTIFLHKYSVNTISLLVGIGNRVINLSPNLWFYKPLLPQFLWFGLPGSAAIFG